uniref:Uncharacterized protein n=1 Tax=Ciona savignyi TaxID=51511 RepID=H2ZEE0_CIOSA
PRRCCQCCNRTKGLFCDWTFNRTCNGLSRISAIIYGPCKHKLCLSEIYDCD